MKLNKEDWKKLDELLSKIGFGGYYDFVECLKIILKNLTLKRIDNIKFDELLNKETDIYKLINLILKIQRLLKE